MYHYAAVMLYKQEMQCTCNETLRRGAVTTVAVEKQ
jgi:hypothetical protein